MGKYTEEEWVVLNNAIPEKQEYPELEGTLAICNDIINKGEMNKGKLFKTGWDNWLLKVNGISYPIHQQHDFWLKIFGKEGMEFNFERQGSEVILKENEPDIHEYTQD